MISARICMIAMGLALLGGLACGGDSGTGTTTGTAAVSLATPNADDGAVLVTLTGPGVSNPQAGSSAYDVYFRVVSADELRVLVIGDLSNGVLVTVGVGAVGSIGQYSGTVVEVASRTDVLRVSLAGYSLAFAAR